MPATDTRAAVRAFYTKRVDPLFAGMGFTKGRHRVYRRYNAERDAVVVGIHASGGSRRDRYRFDVGVALTPAPWIRWMRHPDDDSDEPYVGEALVQGRLEPASAADVDYGRIRFAIDHGLSLEGLIPETTWAIDAVESAAEVGREIAERLPAMVQRYLELLDRDVFLDRLREGADLPGTCPRLAARAVLLMERGPSEELVGVLDEIEARQPGSDFVSWVKERAAAVEPRA